MKNQRQKMIGRAAAAVLIVILLFAPPAMAYRFVVYGDSRSTSETTQTNWNVLMGINQQILALNPKPDFAIFLGDPIYQGLTSLGEFGIDAWAEQMKSFTSQIPFFMVMGNQELFSPLANTLLIDCQDEFINIFKTIPKNGPTGYEGLTYSFSSASNKSLFIVLDSFYIPTTQTSASYVATGDITQEQIDWLSRQLATTNAPNKFVFMHAPPFSPTSANYTQCTTANHCQLWRILDSYKVKVLFASHEYLFSRKIMNSAMNSTYVNNVVQLISGPAGAPLATTYTADNTWNVKLAYSYSVVDLDESAGSVVVQSFGGQGGSYSQIDAFTIQTDGTVIEGLSSTTVVRSSWGGGGGCFLKTLFDQ